MEHGGLRYCCRKIRANRNEKYKKQNVYRKEVDKGQASLKILLLFLDMLLLFEHLCAFISL